MDLRVLCVLRGGEFVDYNATRMQVHALEHPVTTFKQALVRLVIDRAGFLSPRIMANTRNDRDARALGDAPAAH